MRKLGRVLSRMLSSILICQSIGSFRAPSFVNWKSSLFPISCLNFVNSDRLSNKETKRKKSVAAEEDLERWRGLGLQCWPGQGSISTGWCKFALGHSKWCHIPMWCTRWAYPKLRPWNPCYVQQSHIWGFWTYHGKIMVHNVGFRSCLGSWHNHLIWFTSRSYLLYFLAFNKWIGVRWDEGHFVHEHQAIHHIRNHEISGQNLVIGGLGCKITQSSL